MKQSRLTDCSCTGNSSAPKCGDPTSIYLYIDCLFPSPFTFLRLLIVGPEPAINSESAMSQHIPHRYGLQDQGVLGLVATQS